MHAKKLVHLEYSNTRLKTSSGKTWDNLVHMCPSEPDEECKEIHHVWGQGFLLKTPGIRCNVTSKEEVVDADA